MDEQQVPANEEQPAEWSYAPEHDEPGSIDEHEVAQHAAAEVSWTASEFIAHEKSAGWFMLLALVTLVLGAAVYLVSNRDIFSVIVVLVVSAVVGIYANRKPRELEYIVDRAGIHISDKTYAYDLFKSFSLMQEGAVNSIQLMPLKRFMPTISMYVAPDEQEHIVDTLGDYLPLEERQHDAIDRLMHRIRF